MLTGTIDTLSITETLALLGTSKVTGTMRIEGEGSGLVVCHAGAITYASSDATITLRDQLELHGFGHGDVADLAIESILAGSDSKRLVKFLRTHIEEAVFELDLWEQGSFEFASDRSAGDAGFAYEMEPLLGAVADRRQAWPALLAHFPSLDSVVAQPDLEGVDDDDVVISRAQARLLTAVDGRRTIRQLARELGQGLFQTCQVLRGLLEDELVTLRPSRASRRLDLTTAAGANGHANGHANGNGTSTNGHSNGNGNGKSSNGNGNGNGHAEPATTTRPGDGLLDSLDSVALGGGTRRDAAGTALLDGPAPAPAPAVAEVAPVTEMVEADDDEEIRVSFADDDDLVETTAADVLPAMPAVDFVSTDDRPARDLILRLLSSVKDL